MTYYSFKDVVDLLLCFPKLVLFLLVRFLMLCTSPAHARVEMLPVRAIREAVYLQVFGGGYFSQPHLVNLKGTHGI